MEDEIITFYVPSFWNSIFVHNVQEEDEKEIIEMFQRIGQLYHGKRLKDNPSTIHIWFYSKNAYNRAKREYSNPFYINQHQYRINVLSSLTKVKSTRKLLKLNEMYDLCNYYIGFQGWNTEISSLTCDFQDEEKINGKVKYYVQYTTITKITFPLFPNVVVRGYGRSKSSSYKDKMFADKIAKKFAISCARKDMFKKLFIVILVEIKNGVCNQKAVPTVLENFNEDEDGINQLFIQNYEENEDEENEEELDDDFTDILKQM